MDNNNNNNNEISNFLGVDDIPLPEIIGDDVDATSQEMDTVIHHDSVLANATDDYVDTRANLKQLIYSGTGAIGNLIKVANESDSPRAYEVLSTYMKSLADINAALMGLHKEVKDITKESSDNKNQIGELTNNNYIFTGSTEDLQDMILENAKGKLK